MSKHKTIWGGPSRFSNKLGSKIKFIPFPIAPQLPIPRDILPFNKNGFVLQNTADTDLHIVADDLSLGSDWVSRTGSYIAALNGQPTIGDETPFYPLGGFSGSGYRTATTNYTSSNYYAFPNDSQHDFTDTNQISYEMIIKVGHQYANETILSRYLFPFYNFKVKISYTGVYSVDVYVGMSITSPQVTLQVDPYTYNMVHIIWDGPTSTLTVGVNGYFSSSTGAGTVNVPAGPCTLNVGCDTNFIDYMTSGQIVEIMRHRYLMPQSTAINRLNNFAGMQSVSGQLPQYFNRSTRGELFVNNKIFSFGSNFPRLNEKGLLLENFYNGFIKNNFFDTDLSFLQEWNYASAGLSTVTAYSDSDSFSQIGGTGIKVYTDNVGSLSYFYQQTTTQYQANYRVNVDIWVKSLDLGCYPVLYIISATSGNYYDITNSLWSATPLYNVITTTSTNIEKFSFSMVNEGSNASFTYFFGGYDLADNQDKSFVIYGISDNMSEQKQSIKVNRDLSTVMSYEYLRYDKSMVKMDKDKINFSITYQSSAAILPYSYMNRFVFADSAGFLKMDLGTNNLRLSDSFGSSALITGSSYVADQEIRYGVQWDKTTSMTLNISDFTESLSVSNSCVNDIDNNLNYFYIGCDPIASNNVLDAYIKDVRFYDV